MNRGPDDPSGPDRTTDQFEAIVAGWRREGAVPVWPVDERPPVEPPRTPPQAVPPVPPVPPVPSVPPVPPPGSAWFAEPETERLDHFVPPEPPPLPRIGPPAVVGFTLLTLGLALVTAPAVVGVPTVYGLPLGLLSLACGLGWLVLRLWPGPTDHRDEDDDGAQL